MSISQLNSSRFPPGYFETDAALQKIIGVDTNGRIKTRDVSSITVDSIYTADGVLDSDRTVDGGTNNLTFTNSDTVTLESNVLTTVASTVEVDVDAPAIGLAQLPPTDNTVDDLLVRNAGTTELQVRKASTLKTYDAIVDAGGDGDYTLLSAALTAGASNIFVRSGTYVEPANVNIFDRSLNIEGENIADTIITGNGFEFGNGAFEGAGTITMTANDATVTGSGTDFLSIPAGYVLAVRGVLYQIESVASDTSMEVSPVYRGQTESGIQWYAVPPIALNMSNIRFHNITGNGLSFNGASSVNLNYVRVSECTVNGIEIARTVNYRLENCFFSSCEEGFISEDDLGLAHFNNCIASNCRASGFRFGDSQIAFDVPSASILMSNCFSYGNGGNGIQVLTANTACHFTNVTSMFNGAGMALNRTPNATVTNCTFKNNQGVGLGINNNSVNNSAISNCIFRDNGAWGISGNRMDDIKITNCQFEGNVSGSLTFNDCNATIISNCVSRDTVFMDATNGGYGLTGNSINNCTVALSGSGGHRIDSNSLRRITLTNTPASRIIGNVFNSRNDSNTCIALDANCNLCTVSQNHINQSNNSGTGISVAGDNNTVIGNTKQNNGGGTFIDDTGTGNEVHFNVETA